MKMALNVPEAMSQSITNFFVSSRMGCSSQKMSRPVQVDGVKRLNFC